MNDTPRTNFVAHETGDTEWDRFPNRFGRMMAHACILERENAAAQAEIAALRHFVDNNMCFYDVDTDSLLNAPNIPVLAAVSKRIWYHATDDTKSCPFSAVIDAAMKECGK
jgi:hypothetical protein